MAAVRSDILRCGVRVVCEIMIAELKDILLRKRKRRLMKLSNDSGNLSATSAPCKGGSAKVQELLRKKQVMDDKRKLARKKMMSESRRKRLGKPQPITMVSVEGINMAEPASASEDNRNEVILPDDPLGNIQIKQEVEDNDITFEEHFEDMNLPTIKTEVKDELVYGDPDELLESTVLDSSSCDTFEDGNLKKKPKLEDLHMPSPSSASVKPSHSSTSAIPEKPAEKLQESVDVPGPCEKPYVCKTCLKRFSTCNDLRKHAALHERSTMKFHCKKCNLKFSTRTKLKEHLNRHVRQEKLSPVIGSSMLHTCRYCKRGYSALSLLSKHKLLHKRAKSSASDRIVTKYKEHPRDINPLVESKIGNPFKCKYCLKSYRLISELVRHAYIHPYPQRYAYPDVNASKYIGFSHLTGDPQS